MTTLPPVSPTAVAVVAPPPKTTGAPAVESVWPTITLTLPAFALVDDPDAISTAPED
jgi:hypothetical protein